MVYFNETLRNQLIDQCCIAIPEFFGDDQALEEAADALLEAGFSIHVPVVKAIAIDKYEVVSGIGVLHALQLAHAKDEDKFEQVKCIVLKDDEDEVHERQRNAFVRLVM